MNEAASAGDAFPPDCEIIEVHVAELRQLFNSMDPSPFHDRDLDPSAEEFIVSWSMELPRDAPLGLLIYLDRPAGLADEAVVLRDAIHQFFSERSTATRRRLRQLFRRGRISLVIGLAFLGVSIAFSELLANWTNAGGVVEILRESLSIGGWVAMWRPLEVFLYDWWPIRAEAPVVLCYARPRFNHSTEDIVHQPRASSDKRAGSGTACADAGSCHSLRQRLNRAGFEPPLVTEAPMHCQTTDLHSLKTDKAWVTRSINTKRSIRDFWAMRSSFSRLPSECGRARSAEADGR